jgi:hypothetical protein
MRMKLNIRKTRFSWLRMGSNGRLMTISNEPSGFIEDKEMLAQVSN